MSAALRFGPYELGEVLGGGMGIVHRARRAGDGRDLAIKLMRQERLLDGDARARFVREFAVLRRLRHPAICPLLDAGEIDGMPFLCMPFVPGDCLDALLRAARERGDQVLSLPGSPAQARGWRPIVALFAKVADALQAAHDQGIVHRDVKPANLRIDPQGEPVLLDFGLARDSADRYRDLTRTGQVVGTPAYLAPEQLQAQHGPIGPRTDVYGLAAVLYEALTLRQPFAGNSRLELFDRILLGHPTDPRRLVPDLPADLVEVLEVAMARRLHQRHASIAALAADLRAVLAGRPIGRRRSPASVRAACWLWRRRRTGVAAGLLLAAVGLVARPVLEGAGVLAATEAPSPAPWPVRLLAAQREYAALPPPWPRHRPVLATWLARHRDLAVAPAAADVAAPGLREFAVAAESDVRARLRFAEDEERRVQASPEAARQPGLVPLGADPVSLLQEFYDLASGDPDLPPPTRDQHGVLQLHERHGIVFVLLPGHGAVAPFLLGKYEMTRSQYSRLSHGVDPSLFEVGEVVAGTVQTWRHPVTRVQYADAVALLARWGMELPSWSRWNHAAGAAGWPDYLDEPHPFARAVGQFAPNPLGLHDMFGNVAELCADPDRLPPRSPDGRAQHRIAGGSAGSGRMTAEQLQFSVEGERHHRVGLRAARSVEAR